MPSLGPTVAYHNCGGSCPLKCVTKLLWCDIRECLLHIYQGLTYDPQLAQQIYAQECRRDSLQLHLVLSDLRALGNPGPNRIHRTPCWKLSLLLPRRRCRISLCTCLMEATVWLADGDGAPLATVGTACLLLCYILSAASCSRAPRSTPAPRRPFLHQYRAAARNKGASWAAIVRPDTIAQGALIAIIDLGRW